MKDERKTKAQLIEELEALRRAAEIEQALDRVRTSVAQMDGSASLLGPVQVVQRELVGLGVAFRGAGANTRSSGSIG